MKISVTGAEAQRGVEGEKVVGQFAADGHLERAFNLRPRPAQSFDERRA